MAKSFTVSDGKLVLVLHPVEEGGYAVTAPFVQGLNTQADTIEQAFELAYDAEKVLRKVRAKLARESTATA